MGAGAGAQGWPVPAPGANAGRPEPQLTRHVHTHGHHHGHAHELRGADARALRRALGLITAFMAVEVFAGVIASSLALLADAAHMLTDAASLGLALLAARLSGRPAVGRMTYGMARAEILSAQANGITLLALAVAIVIGAVYRLVSAPHVSGGLVLVVALVGIPVNLSAARILAGPAARSLNVDGAYRHVLTDLFGFLATAAAAAVILATGFARADAIASLLVAALMIWASGSLLLASGRVFMEAAPAGIDPLEVGNALAGSAGVVQVHDLHVWEVTSGFPALSAHVVVRAGEDCHERRHELQNLLHSRFAIDHTTIQVDHDAATQAPIQIEIVPHRSEST